MWTAPGPHLILPFSSSSIPVSLFLTTTLITAYSVEFTQSIATLPSDPTAEPLLVYPCGCLIPQAHIPNGRSLHVIKKCPRPATAMTAAKKACPNRDFAATNSTFNIFFGGTRKPWMTNFQAAQPSSRVAGTVGQAHSQASKQSQHHRDMSNHASLSQPYVLFQAPFTHASIHT